MQHVAPRDTVTATGAAARESGTDDAATDMSAQAAFSAHEPLDVRDEDTGDDPYNRTGRFRRNVR